MRTQAFHSAKGGDKTPATVESMDRGLAENFVHERVMEKQGQLIARRIIKVLKNKEFGLHEVSLHAQVSLLSKRLIPLSEFSAAKNKLEKEKRIVPRETKFKGTLWTVPQLKGGAR